MSMRFSKLPVYKLAREFTGVERRILEALPAERQDLREMLMHHSSTIAIKIARGTSEPTRAEAYRTFRISQRSTEFCQSLIRGLSAAGLCAAGDGEVALGVLAQLHDGLQTIIDRIREKRSPKEAFGK